MKRTRFGRYELLAELGRGGMAELFLARLGGAGGFSKLLAIKRILPHLSDDPDFVALFLNEARIAAQLTHPNVCTVFELGEADGQLFIAMEYLEGVGWDTLLAALPSDPIERLRVVAGVFAQACEGLHYAHTLTDAAGRATPIVHRDISPQNLFVTTDGTSKVLDFGVSKMLGAPSGTRTGLLKGKLPYMSPEQLRADPLDTRSDVFAMAIVIWEALARRSLFERPTEYLTFKAVEHEAVPAVGSIVPELAFVDAILARALERDRERRTPSIHELGEQLAAAARDVGGPLAPADIGVLVRARCAAQLRRRADQLASSVATPWARMERTDATPLAPQSAALRTKTLLPSRRRARRWRRAALAGAVAVACAAGFAIYRRVAQPAAAAPAGRAPEVSTPLQSAPPVTAPAGRAPEVTTAVAAAPPARAPAPDSPEPAPAPSEPHAPPPSLAAPPAEPHAAAAVHHRAQPATARAGTFSIDSRPYATIYIDGKRRDQTPLFKVKLAAGQHDIRATLADGRERTFTVRIAAGKDTSFGTLTW